MSFIHPKRENYILKIRKKNIGNSKNLNALDRAIKAGFKVIQNRYDDHTFGLNIDEAILTGTEDYDSEEVLERFIQTVLELYEEYTGLSDLY